MDELNGPAGEGYQRMIKASAAGGRHPRRDRHGSRILDGRDGAFITGADLLIDGGVIAAIATGRYRLGLR
jgi:hypothetical protein